MLLGSYPIRMSQGQNSSGRGLYKGGMRVPASRLFTRRFELGSHEDPTNNISHTRAQMSILLLFFAVAGPFSFAGRLERHEPFHKFEESDAQH